MYLPIYYAEIYQAINKLFLDFHKRFGLVNTVAIIMFGVRLQPGPDFYLILISFKLKYVLEISSLN